MKHRILISSDSSIKKPVRVIKGLLRRAIICALEAEAVNVPCELNVLLTDDNGIRAVNRNMRNLDKPTDVLSFPMFDFTPGAFDASIASRDPQTGLIALGDMVMSLERIRSQAKEYGHGAEREAAYLAVHSVLHLLGYDHMDEDGDKRIMRAREEEIMKKLGLAGTKD